MQPNASTETDPPEPDVTLSTESNSPAESTAVTRAPRSKLFTAIIVFAVIGFAIAAYTTIVHYVGFAALACFGANSGHSSCETVQSSIYNNVAGIPVAVLGLVGYFFILTSLAFKGELARAATFAFVLIGFIFSLYLTYREAFSIHAYCEWCLGSAGCLTILVVLTAIRFIRADPADLSRFVAPDEGDDELAGAPATQR